MNKIIGTARCLNCKLLHWLSPRFNSPRYRSLNNGIARNIPIYTPACNSSRMFQFTVAGMLQKTGKFKSRPHSNSKTWINCFRSWIGIPTHDTFFSVQIKQKKTNCTHTINNSIAGVCVCHLHSNWDVVTNHLQTPGSMLNQKEIHGKHKIILRQLVTWHESFFSFLFT